MLSLMRKYIGRIIMVMGITIAFLLTSLTPLHAQQAAPQAVVYSADLKTINESLPGNKAKGKAEFRVSGDELLITLNAEGLTPDMMILAHVHGFSDGKKAACATMKEDANKDGFIDPREAAKVNGPEIIALNGEPQDLDIKEKSYPKADKMGMIQYSKKVSLKKLQKNLNKKYKMTTIPFENMVVNLHGVDKKTKLPASVQSEMKLPAYQTIPVACGEIKKAQQ